MHKTLRTLALALVAAAALPVASASAQDKAFSTGTKLLNLGVVTDPTGFGGGVELGLLSLAPNVTLGIGGTVAYQSESSVSVTWIVGNANVHYAIPDIPALDLFAGVSFGIANANVDGVGNDDADGSESVVGVNLGGRFMLTPKLGAFAQLGLADAPELFFGLTIKF